MAKVIRASVLVLILACSAQAGHIHNDVPAPPPSAVQEPTDASDEQTTDGIIQNEAPDSLTQTVLDLLTLLPRLL